MLICMCCFVTVFNKHLFKYYGILDFSVNPDGQYSSNQNIYFTMHSNHLEICHYIRKPCSKMRDSKEDNNVSLSSRRKPDHKRIFRNVLDMFISLRIWRIQDYVRWAWTASMQQNSSLHYVTNTSRGTSKGKLISVSQSNKKESKINNSKPSSSDVRENWLRILSSCICIFQNSVQQLSLILTVSL
jgi:hypothetical protein